MFGLLTLAAQLVSNVHLIWWLMIPLCGFWHGPELAIRVSFNLLIYISITAAARIVMRSKDIEMFASIIQLPVCACLLYLPAQYLPPFVVCFYGHVQALIGLMAPLAEALEVVALTMATSEAAVAGIDATPMTVKTLILSVSGLCYALAGWLLMTLFNAKLTTVQFSLVILVVLMVMAVHVVMWNYEVGIVSDVAVLSLYILFITQCMILDYSASGFSPVMDDTSRVERSLNGTFLEVFLSTIAESFDSCGRLTTWAFEVIKPWTLVRLLLRLFMCLAFVRHVHEAIVHAQTDDEESTELPNRDNRELKRDLFQALLVVLMTSAVTERASFDNSVYATYCSWFAALTLGGVAPLPVAQMFLALGVYTNRVISDESDDVG